MNDKESSYENIWENLFNDLFKYWAEKYPGFLTAPTEESLSDLSLPISAQTRLCYFDIPDPLITFYRSDIFPIFEYYGFVPVTTTDLISPGDNVLAAISSLIERAILIVIHISMPSQTYLHALELSKEKKVPIVIIVDENARVPSALHGLMTLRYPVNDGPQNERFLEHLKNYVKDISSNLIQNLLDEPERLLAKREYRAAVISAVSLLETELTSKLQDREELKIGMRSPSFRRLAALATSSGLMDEETAQKMIEYYFIRSRIVHHKSDIDPKHAQEIVNEVIRHIRRIRNEHKPSESYSQS